MKKNWTEWTDLVGWAINEWSKNYKGMGEMP
jgi:hypothetical protein